MLICLCKWLLVVVFVSFWFLNVSLWLFDYFTSLSLWSFFDAAQSPAGTGTKL